MDNYDLLQELQSKTHQLETSIRLLRKNGTAYAEAERDYKMCIRDSLLTPINSASLESEKSGEESILSLIHISSTKLQAPPIA